MRASNYYIGRPVTSLQTMLRGISYTDDRILPVISDGKYGKSTYASVLSFQQVHGLPLTGNTDLQTWNAISDAYAAMKPGASAVRLFPTWPQRTALSPGDRNFHVYLAQAMLLVLSEFFSELPVLQLTGIIDTDTAAALRWLQTAASLPAAGNLDAITWYHLNSIYRTMVGDGF